MGLRRSAGKAYQAGVLEQTSAPLTLCPPDGRFPTGPLAGEWRAWAIHPIYLSWLFIFSRSGIRSGFM